MITFTEILTCNGTVIYEVERNHMSFFTSGTLQILLAYDGMVLLKLNQFQYGVNGGQQILYDRNDPQFSLILYFKKYPQGQWILKVNDNSDAIFSCLCEKSHLKDKNPRQKKEYGQKEYERKEEVKYEEKVVGRKQQVVLDNEEENQTKEKQNLLIEASKQLGKGLKFTGGLLSKGFSSLGGFIAKKVSKKQDKEISQNTKDNLKLAKDTTKNVLQFTSQQVGNLFNFGKKVAGDIGQRFEKSQKGQQLKENPYYDKVKQGTKTGVGVLANIYDGVVDAVYSVGSGVAKGAGKVIGARYGEDAGEAADQVLEGAGNIAKVIRVPADQTAKALK